MEYYELQQLWDNKDKSKVDLELNQKAVSELMKNKIIGNLGEIKWSGIIEIVITVFWLNFLVPIILDHAHEVGILISGIVLLVLLLLGQTMSFINYDFTVSLGLQEPVDAIGKLGVALFAFLAGWIVDRFGPRRVMLVGIILGGVALIGLGNMTSPSLGLVAK